MREKINETITRWILVIAALTSLIVALGLTFNVRFPTREYLIGQHLLSDAIALFGILAAGFIAAIVLLYVNRQIQTYSWRRDQALKDIEMIYEPLYKDISEAVNQAENFGSFALQSATWLHIHSSYLGTKLKLLDSSLYDKLQDTFDKLRDTEYGEKRRSAISIIREIAKKVIERYLKGDLEVETRELILRDMPASLDYEGYVYRGFLLGKTVRKWSALNFNGEEEYLVEWSWKEINGKSYSQQQSFTREHIEAILDEIYQNVQDDAAIRQIVVWCRMLSNEVAQIEKELENRILKPQLP